MRRIGMPLALVLVLAADGLVLFGVYRNRSGEPDAVVELTERELSASRSGGENTGMSLTLRWDVRGDWAEEPGWFDREKLEAIGFDCSFPLEDPGAITRYSRMLPRDVYAVLEFDGEAWEEWMAHREEVLADLEADVERGEATREQLQDRRDAFETRKLTGSRLFVVDAGIDPRGLRGRYPDRSRYVVTPALVRVRTIHHWDGETGDWEVTGLRGAVTQILVDQIHVPRPLRFALERILEEEEPSGPGRYRRPRVGKPRFAAVLRYGRRYEPALTAIRPLDPG